jgi:hypothetical protein
VHIGYYNGTDISTLADDQAPRRDRPLADLLEKARQLLETDQVLTDIAIITVRPSQITLEPKSAVRTDALVSHVMARLAVLDGRGLRILCSSHSLDVLGPGSGKLALVSELRKKIGDQYEVLCIGDRGAWPGNDYALLSQSLSLSVDEVSGLEDSCWNLAPSGMYGPDATLLYLRAIKVEGSVGTFTWKEAVR